LTVSGNPVVSVVVGSKSDLGHAAKAAEVLKGFGVDHGVVVLSAHRTPEQLRLHVQNSGARVFIAMAGVSAHLAGVIASYTTRPVIGVPLAAKLGGLDSLLSTVNMPRGVPVACVSIDGAENAALLAVEILAVSDEALAGKIREYRRELAEAAGASGILSC